MDRNVAVVGCGYWGKNLVRNFAELGALHTICDSDAEKLKGFQSLYPWANTEIDYHRVLQIQEIRGIVVATPAVLHYSMAKEALLAGKDVFVEKPFTTSSEDAQDLVDVSHRQQRILMVGHLLLYHPAVQMLKRYIQSGELGEVYYLYSTRVNLGQIRQDENALWRLVPHDVAMFVYLLDEYPAVISAQGSSYLQPDFVDVIFATLKLGRALAHVHASWLDPHKIRQLTVVGSKKMAVFDDMEPEYKLRIYDKGVISNTLLTRSGEAIFPRVELAEPLLVECQEFRCMVERRQPLSNAEQGVEVVKTLEALQQLLDAGQRR
ncbi:Inositol 2-dehydrogenase/D-chiro-inositol 3-dehydrogenase [subsurface metagenome]